MGKRSFGQITRLPSKRYRARYTGPDTVLHNAPSTFDTRMDAEAWLTDERRLISAGTWTPPASRLRAAELAELERRRSVFAPYARGWLAGRHDLRATTRASYRTAIERHLVPAFGGTPLTEISASLIRSWFQSYGERTPTARAHAYQVLGAVMAQAEQDELIMRNPCRIKAGGRTTVAREPEVLTLAELLALADAMPPQHRALTLLCGLCGLRFGEAVALRRRDVDLESGVVSVARTAVRAGGAKTTNAPKTPAGKREVAMPALVVDALRDHLAAHPVRGREALVFPGRDGELLAPSALYGREERVEHRGGKDYRKRAYGFYAAREVVGKPELHWHDLRRTAATLGAQSGATVREMQHRLGHTTPTMALRYQAATAERDRAIADRLQAQIDRLRAAGTVTPLRHVKAE
ncbi:tyrosine-type recombinase/integrase [Ornithinimicrobium flavum]|uniref:tyrosine-type recombinase/integrase n=1 Tax=Ornithinimicrobium flavum TaxID=1288636 RepID=UPI00106F4906|nr:tyrosine-type recombinase/integrase [Ornithinimicrobium flavum]